MLNRAMINNIGAFGNMLIWSIFYPASRFQSEVGKLARSKMQEDIMIGEGPYGFTDVKQQAPNIFRHTPLLSRASKFTKDKSELVLPHNY